MQSARRESLHHVPAVSWGEKAGEAISFYWQARTYAFQVVTYTVLLYSTYCRRGSFDIHFRKRLDQSTSLEVTIAVLGKVPGSEGNHGQTAKHRQYCVNVARLGSTQL